MSLPYLGGRQLKLPNAEVISVQQNAQITKSGPCLRKLPQKNCMGVFDSWHAVNLATMYVTFLYVVD